MIDFDLDFIDKNSFEFIDLSDYAGTTVIDTNLSMFLPPIENSDDPNVVPLYSTTIVDLPVITLGNDATIDLTSIEQPFTLVDGVYRVIYNVILEGGTVTSTEKIFIKDLDILQCKRALIKDLITNPNSEKCKACEATFFDSALASAYHEAEMDNYKEATEIVEYLKSECQICNC